MASTTGAPPIGAHFHADPTIAIDQAMKGLVRHMRSLSEDLSAATNQGVILRLFPSEIVSHFQLLRSSSGVDGRNMPWVAEVQRRDILDGQHQIEVTFQGAAHADARYGVIRDTEAVMSFAPATFSTLYNAVETSLLSKLSEAELKALSDYRVSKAAAPATPKAD